MPFAPTWLSLREPYDLRARNGAVVESLCMMFAAHSALSIVDLGCGTGAGMRALSPHLVARQSWRLIDNDLSLLARVETPAGVTARSEPLDLARDLELALDGPVDLVVTSSLLDLVSPAWLQRLVTELAARRLPFYAALSFDGRLAFEPDLADDAPLLAQFRADLQTDKGFGPALGAYAAAAAARLFGDVDYEVTSGRADWLLGPADGAMQSALLDFIARAAQDKAAAPRWLAQRRDAISTGRSRLQVGHIDFVARPRRA
jgi:hypothetical protein